MKVTCLVFRCFGVISLALPLCGAACLKYMEVKLIAEFPFAPIDDFLSYDDYEIGKKLICGKTTEMQSFRVQSREFIDRLIFVLVERISATASFSRCLSSFCPEIMLDGNNNAVFNLFSELSRVLLTCGVLTLDETKAAMEEFTSYFV